MKKRFGILSKREQEQVEAQYHATRAEEFDPLMTGAKRHSPDVIKLPAPLAAKLRIRAEQKGKREYEAMVLAWVEERIRKENESLVSQEKDLLLRNWLLQNDSSQNNGLPTSPCGK